MEAALVMAIAGLVSLVVGRGISGRVNLAKVQACVSSLHAISDSAQQYQSLYGRWPEDIEELKGMLLSERIVENVFGHPYEIITTDKMATISTQIPVMDLKQTFLAPHVVIKKEGRMMRLSINNPRRFFGAPGVRYGI